MTMLRRQVENPSTGYALDDGPLSWWSVIAPEGTTNLCTNPSVELSANGFNDWSSSGAGTRTRSAEDAYFGRFSYKIDKTNTVAASEWGTYIFTPAAVIGQVYTLSAYVRTTGKLKVQLISPGIPSGMQKLIYSSEWVRVVFTVRSTTVDQIQMRFALMDGTGVAYIDGIQFEAKPYATTYCDGEQPDCSWEYSPSLSSSEVTSTRPNESRKGGRLINFRQLKWVTTAIIGAGLSALITADTQYALGGGGYYQRSIPSIRNFQIVGSFEAESDIDVARQRATLADLLKPNSGLGMRPIRLVYQQVGQEGDPLGEIVNIDAVYTGGLEGNTASATGEKVALGFRTYLPYVLGNADRVFDQSLSFQSSFGNAYGIVMRNAQGGWQAMGAGLGTSQTVFRVWASRLNGGPVYAVGTFTTSGGSGISQFAQWNPVPQTWTVVGSFVSGNGNGISAITEDFQGRIYIGGSFDNTSAGTPAGARGMARWNPADSTWTTYQVSFGGRVNVFGRNFKTGEIIVCGLFTTIGGITASSVAELNSSSGVWRALTSTNYAGQGADDEVFAVASTARGDVIIGGKFNSVASGGIAAKRLAQFSEPNEITKLWGPLTSGAGPTFAGSGSAPNTFVQSLAYSPDGTLYIGGQFDTWDGQAAYGIAKYVGQAITPLYPLLRSNGSLINVFMLKWLDGRLHVGGNFLGPSGVDVYDRYLIWNGSAWIVPDIDMPGDAVARDIEYNRYTKEYYLAFGGVTGGAATSLANGLTEVLVSSPLPAPAKLVFVGPMSLYSVKNIDTGKEIYLNLKIQSAEEVILQTGPEWYFKSNQRGDLSAYILPGSNVADFYLVGGGSNTISVYVQNYDGATLAKVMFSNAFDTLDGAAVQR